jgi:hypothetical protein
MQNLYAGDSMKYDSKSLKEPFPGSSVLTSLIPFSRLNQTTFPTFSQLVQEENVPSEKKTRAGGLFSDLFGGDPLVLLQDVLDHPGKYEEGVYSLVLALAVKQRKVDDLTSAELQTLNHAALDFYHRPVTKEQLPYSTRTVPERKEDDERDIEHNEDSPFPENAPAAYWWLR